MTTTPAPPNTHKPHGSSPEGGLLRCVFAGVFVAVGRVLRVAELWAVSGLLRRR
ncbi:hypothetical protein [Streptomyces griseosporeus]|uniref:hypothetical protein n=1 Tax=Streptomyces griseosporeus TaxID=1910 RepID=UPI003799A511